MLPELLPGAVEPVLLFEVVVLLTAALGPEVFPDTPGPPADPLLLADGAFELSAVPGADVVLDEAVFAEVVLAGVVVPAPFPAGLEAKSLGSEADC